jgi:hypothetical protein
MLTVDVAALETNYVIFRQTGFKNTTDSMGNMK